MWLFYEENKAIVVENSWSNNEIIDLQIPKICLYLPSPFYYEWSVFLIHLEIILFTVLITFIAKVQRKKSMWRMQELA